MSYRALEGTNTKTRRLAYLTAIISMLRRTAFSERVLLGKLVDWSQSQKQRLKDYWVHTGEVTSTRRNSAGARYLQLATNLGLIVPISGTLRSTRIGLVLLAVLNGVGGTALNPFYLTKAERIFYLYLLLNNDADLFLTVVDYVHQNLDTSLAQAQKDFQQVFIQRLTAKVSNSVDEVVRRNLLQRRQEVAGTWESPERYAEHLVPPRLNWLLDLGLLEPGRFKRHRYAFIDVGDRIVASLPMLGKTALHDVTNDWLQSEFWVVAARELVGQDSIVLWSELDDDSRSSLCGPLLKEAFRAFRHTAVPKVSLTQVLVFLSIRLVLGEGVATGPNHLAKWLSDSQSFDNRRYEVRFSPRENESYLVMMSS